MYKGERPEKPNFDATLGYTEELWEMTTSCWKEDPGDRPTVDCVLETFKSAAEWWETEHEEIDTPSPQAWLELNRPHREVGFTHRF